MINPMNILNAREERVQLQENLIKKYKVPLLIIRVNYPGTEKNNNTTTFICNTLYMDINKKLQENNINILHIEKINSYEGLIYLMSIDEESIKLKKLAVEIERNHMLGRLVDLDIVNLENHTISRKELGYLPRNCFLCDEIAHNCVRSRKHSLEEILKYIEKLVADYKSL